MILVTDEPRSNTEPLTLNETRAILQDGGWLLHAILDQDLIPNEGIGTRPIQGSGNYTVYLPEEDLSTATNYTELSVADDPIGFGCCADYYVPLAFETGGVVWNLNKLRNGGLDAAAFTQAFIEITQEIITEIITDPEVCPYEGILVIFCLFWWLWNLLLSFFGL